VKQETGVELHEAAEPAQPAVAAAAAVALPAPVLTKKQQKELDKKKKEEEELRTQPRITHFFKATQQPAATQQQDLT
jgi:ribosomal protein L12E/L44/L45/RPP1/RPP2